VYELLATGLFTAALGSLFWLFAVALLQTFFYERRFEKNPIIAEHRYGPRRHAGFVPAMVIAFALTGMVLQLAHNRDVKALWRK
jgi:hypothetical protein